MPVPALTPEQRAEALSRATAARRRRAEVKQQLKQGRARLREVVEDREDEAIARMKVSELIESLPGIGRAKAGQIMDELGIAGSRRVRGLGPHQTRALLDHVEQA